MVRNRLNALFDLLFLIGPSTKPAMTDTSAFQEVRSSPSPVYRFLQKQRHQYGTGSRKLFHAYDLTALSTGISTKLIANRKLVVSGSLPSGVLSSNGLKDQS